MHQQQQQYLPQKGATLEFKTMAREATQRNEDSHTACFFARGAAAAAATAAAAAVASLYVVYQNIAKSD